MHERLGQRQLNVGFCLTVEGPCSTDLRQDLAKYSAMRKSPVALCPGKLGNNKKSLTFGKPADSKSKKYMRRLISSNVLFETW